MVMNGGYAEGVDPTKKFDCGNCEFGATCSHDEQGHIENMGEPPLSEEDQDFLKNKLTEKEYSDNNSTTAEMTTPEAQSTTESSDDQELLNEKLFFDGRAEILDNPADDVSPDWSP